MKYKLTLAFFLFVSINLFSQEKSNPSTQNNDDLSSLEDKKEIEKLIVQIFDGMRAGDSSMVSFCFFKDVEMFTSYTNRDGEPMLKKGDFEGFLKAIGTPHDEIWDEKIWDMEIRIDNNLAQVWTKYAFYAGGNFSHCGVDAFHLTRTKTGWKIFHLTDTRQRKDCNLPKKD